MTIYLPPNRSLQDYMISIHEQDELGLYGNLGPCDLCFMVQCYCQISFTLWDVRKRYFVLMSQ